MTTDEFVRAIHSTGLARHENDLLALCLNSIAVKCEAVDDEFGRGVSKLGGLPDLPPEVPWPKCKKEPLSFVAQFRMTDVAEYDTDRLLPSTGMMYFFYDAGQDAWGFDPSDKGRWKVMHYDGEMSKIVRRAAPAVLLAEARLGSCAVTLSQESTFPPWESYEAQKLGMSEEEMSAYKDILLPLEEYREVQPTHRLLGHPDIVQNDMQLECQLVTHGLYCGDESGYNDPRAASLEGGAADWRLLLQVDTEEDIEMTWGDSGRLYFWIPKDALVRHDYDQVWVVLQSY